MPEKQFEDFMGRLFFADSKGPIEKYESKFKDRGYQYYVFLYPNHVITECPQYWNAAYVLEGTDNWQTKLGLSRKEFRMSYKGRVHRIFHTGGWKEWLGKYLN